MDFFDETQVTFAGDWHGQTGWAQTVINACPDKVIYQVGDFGIWPGTHGVKYLTKLNKFLRERGKYLLVVPGNHEDYNRIVKWEVNDYGFQFKKAYERIFLVPRGHVWTQGGKTFAAMGGAASVDKNYRTENVSWWPGEAITMADIDNLEKNVNGPVDYMLTHEIPDGIDMGNHYSFRIPDDIQRYADEQRKFLRLATDIAKPTTLIHGHWHKFMRGLLVADTYKISTLGLGCDGSAENAVSMNLDTGEFNFVLIPGRMGHTSS